MDPVPGVPLSTLLNALPWPVQRPIPDPLIRGIVLDSRQVRPGDLFMVLVGGNVDAHRYIPDAVQRGAAAVVGSRSAENLDVPYIQIAKDRARSTLAKLSAALYGNPARQMVMIGVTGTDGKTTTSNLIYQILRAAGISVGLISTVNAIIGDETIDTGFHVTTPEAPEVQRYLARMHAAGITHVILEATSHGLAQERVAECDFDLGVVTNITHEHLDYHGSYEAYRAAKARLFTSLSRTPAKAISPPRAAILNRDDQSYAFLSGVTQVAQISYGFDIQSDWQPFEISMSLNSSHFVAKGKDHIGQPVRLPLAMSLVGAYNVSNALAAVACCVQGLGIQLHAVRQGIASLPGVPGRMERIDLGQPFTAIVDFAHTPNALTRTLQAARQLTSGRVIAIFGSAGLRDRQKRRMMAEVSAELADISILTAEDPRTESLSSILEEMAQGALSKGGVEGQSYWRVHDRGEAMRLAVELAQPGDLVIACGKGHEQSMCFGEVEYPWDDRVALQAALSELLGVPGPAMPFLPPGD
ncbi:MAG TPA: UDP-N-acetylmuramoyl-L-alanyl-D-glutamate--2,6-diaminopimelate ligase [Anaerolineales bacterium]|nr:UDP-N-acetylmuramoyl-L-alanyl-D-glutamate--2,6-diaminopimelate ligase [Anaerolineales bacterium]